MTKTLLYVMSKDNIIPKYFFSYATKSIKSDDGLKRYPISSTSYDRDGDNMTVEFLNYLADQINNNHVAFFTDHGMGPNGYYSVLDKLGDWHDAIVTDDILYAALRLRDSPITPQLEQITEILNNNIPTTFSIGFIPGEMEENKAGGYSFKTGDILETSAVGIPSNPDAVSGLSHIKAYMEAYKKSMQQNTESEVEIMKQKEEKPNEEEQEEEKMEDEEEEKSSPEITLDAMKSAVKEAVKEALKELKEEEEEEKEDEEEEEKADEDEEEEEEKSAPEPKGKGAGTPPETKSIDGPFKTMF